MKASSQNDQEGCHRARCLLQRQTQARGPPRKKRSAPRAFAGTPAVTRRLLLFRPRSANDAHRARARAADEDVERRGHHELGELDGGGLDGDEAAVQLKRPRGWPLHSTRTARSASWRPARPEARLHLGWEMVVQHARPRRGAAGTVPLVSLAALARLSGSTSARPLPAFCFPCGGGRTFATSRAFLPRAAAVASLRARGSACQDAGFPLAFAFTTWSLFVCA